MCLLLIVRTDWSWFETYPNSVKLANNKKARAPKITVPNTVLTAFSVHTRPNPSAVTAAAMMNSSPLYYLPPVQLWRIDGHQVVRQEGTQ